MAEDRELTEVATAVSESAHVDWDDIARRLRDDEQRQVLRELRVLSTIAGVARDSAGPSASATRTPNTPEPQAWGHLRLLDEIGRGAFGVVYRAWDTRLECQVALKLTRPSGRSVDEDRARALKEARLLARVRHQNVVTVHGADCFDGRYGVWMDCITGLNLEDLLQQQGPMDAVEASRVGRDLCGALAAVHGHGLLHRDLKARNVMRESGGRIVLMDFGTGGRIPAAGDLVSSRTGTPLYLAPELFNAGKPSVASDIYSLGVLLYHLVTDAYPIDGRTIEEVERAHRQDARHLLRDRRPDLPPAFVEVVERALSPDPKLRYQTAGRFDAALARATGVPAPSPLWWWTRVAAAAGIVVVAAGATILVRHMPGEPGSRSARSVASVSSPGVAAVPKSAPHEGTSLPAADAYRVSAQFFAERGGNSVKLRSGSRVSLRDQLFLTVEASAPVFVYVINQDENMAHLLFPLPGVEPTNPLAAGTWRLPGLDNWVIDTVGRREQFAVLVTPERIPAIDALTATLPRAERGIPQVLPDAAVGVLRGVGGLTPSTRRQGARVDLGEFEPLPDGPVTARGLWARQIVFENPR
jgi:eukaryotic-like serine/threonine-protein kinase